MLDLTHSRAARRYDSIKLQREAQTWQERAFTPCLVQAGARQEPYVHDVRRLPIVLEHLSGSTPPRYCQHCPPAR
eukprot:1435674-Pyramimonas_sp.AAC.1